MTAAEGASMSADYWSNMAQVYAAVLERGKFSWQQLWYGQPYGTEDLKYPWPAKGDVFKYLGGTGPPPPHVTKGGCASQLRALCNGSSPAQTRAMIFPSTPAAGQRKADPANLTSVSEDLANFLLVRSFSVSLTHSLTHSLSL